jgi:SAM-dependent methyltransferase
MLHMPERLGGAGAPASLAWAASSMFLGANGAALMYCAGPFFAAIVDAHAQASPDLLDMGTGGGEWLSRLPHLPARTVATEGWAPNVPVARARLEPMGVEVVAVRGAPDNVDQVGAFQGGDLPFPDGSFHLVTNRHESFVAREVARILVPGGRFLTQQVASGLADDFHRLLEEELPVIAKPWTLALAVQQITDAGLEIEDAAEGSDRLSFADIGAFAWYLKNLPWVYPGFSIADVRTKLERLHHRIQKNGALIVQMPLFRLSARLPG